LLLRAAKDFGLNLSKCYVIGDSLTDVKAGKAVGCHAFLIGLLKCDMCKFMEDEDAKPDLIVPSLFAASKIIEKEISGSIKPNLMVSKVFHASPIIEKEMNKNGNIP
jgi:hypothetical protein